MKKSLIQFFGAVVLAAGLLTSGTATGAQISGSVSFDASVVPNLTPLNLTTSLSISGATVDQTSGAYGIFASGTPVFFQSPFTVGIGTSYTPVWSIGSPTPTAWFDLAGVTFISKSANFLYLEGSGTAFLDGYDPTPGFFNLTVNSSSGATFQFGADTSTRPTPVPEGGAALALLGLGLIGIEGARRRLKSAIS